MLSVSFRKSAASAACPPALAFTAPQALAINFALFFLFFNVAILFM